MDETNGQAQTIALGCESPLSEMADTELLFTSRMAHLPPKDQAISSPSSKQRSLLSFCLESF